MPWLTGAVSIPYYVVRIVIAAWPNIWALVLRMLPIAKKRPSLTLHEIGHGLFTSQTHARAELWLNNEGLRGKWIEITGPVEAVVSEWWGVRVDVRVRVEYPSEFFPLRCYFRNVRLDDVRSLHRFQIVVVEGQIRSIGEDVVRDSSGNLLFYPVVIDLCDLKDCDSRAKRLRDDGGVKFEGDHV